MMPFVKPLTQEEEWEAWVLREPQWMSNTNGILAQLNACERNFDMLVDSKTRDDIWNMMQAYYATHRKA